MQAALRTIAERHGYTASRGPHAGRGSPSELIQALEAGELATVLLDPDDRWQFIVWLECYDFTGAPFGLADTAASVARQLRTSA